ncbi:MAG: restriction endonuclease [Planctomycetota bacterium]
MFRFPRPEDITPAEFEATVKGWFEHFPEKLMSFEAEHLESHVGVDGEFEIDVTVRFTAFGGAEFLVLCECKKHKNPIERGLVQILNDKKRSINAHKAIMVATAPFQSGAKEYAAKNRIGLIEIVSGKYAYIQNSASPTMPAIPDDADPYCGLLSFEMPRGAMFPTAVTSDKIYFLAGQRHFVAS